MPQRLSLILLILCGVLGTLTGRAFPRDDEAFQRAKAAYERQDYATALRAWQPLAQQGEADAQDWLGYMYANGQGVAQNDAEAVQWFQKAADQGHANGQFHLGFLYAAGRGVAQNDAAAVQWYRKAADQGYARGQYALGVMYAAGRGVAQDLAAAVQWFRKAADQGYARGQYNLGVMYEEGQGVAQDLAEAQHWFAKAAEAFPPGTDLRQGAIQARERVARQLAALTALAPLLPARTSPVSTRPTGPHRHAFHADAPRPALVPLIGHTQQILTCAFSPDGTTFVSTAYENSIKLWDVATGRPLRTLGGHIHFVNQLAFSPQGTMLASGSRDETIKLWEVSTGKELRTLQGHKGWVWHLAFSPSGAVLASSAISGSSDDAEVRLWEVKTGRELHVFKNLVGFTPNNLLRFTADGKTLLYTSNNTIKFWDVTAGKELRTQHGLAEPLSLEAQSIGPDFILLAGVTPRTRPGERPPNKGIKLWDLTTGTEVRTLQGHADIVAVTAFHPHSALLATGSHDHTIKLWDTATGAELHTLAGHADVVVELAFSPDGTILASGSGDSLIKFWDVATGHELRTLAGHSPQARFVAFSADSKTVVTGSADDRLRLWNIATGADFRSQSGYYSGSRGLTGGASEVRSVAISPDSKMLASITDPHSMTLVEMATGAQLHRLTSPSSDLQSFISCAFSPDGRTLVSVGPGPTIQLWDITTGTALRTSRGPAFTFNVASVAFSPDGRTLAIGSLFRDDTITLVDMATGQDFRTLQGHPDRPTGLLAFSPDGTSLASVALPGVRDTKRRGDLMIRLWDVATGTELRALSGHPDHTLSLAFSPDGRFLASGGEDNTIKFWEVATGHELRTLQGHVERVTSLGFSPNGRFLASASDDTTTKLWETATGKEVASLIALDENDWLVVTPEGLFDGSPSAWHQVLWRYSGDTFDVVPIEWFFNEFYYPSLLTDLLAGKKPQAPRDLAQIDRRQPVLTLAPVAGQGHNGTASTRHLKVNITVTEAPADAEHPAGSGARDLRLFRNGTLVKAWRGNVLHGHASNTFAVTVPLIAGPNRLTAYAFNHDNVKSEDALFLIRGHDKLKRLGIAYILAIGVNRYSNPEYNLKYAVADMHAFSAELRRQFDQRHRYKRVAVRALRDKAATKANVMRVLAQLARRTQPEDALVVYFAGHGTAAHNQFYLIPHDLGYQGKRTALDQAGLRHMLAHSISDRELEHAFAQSNAGHLLFVIDACNSGQALEAEEKRRGPMNAKGLAQLAYEKGMYILTAAQSFQAAQEAERLGHGLLTYALIEEGLKKAAADQEPRDGQIMVREWLNYATARVPKLQEETMREAWRGRGLTLAFVEGDEKIAAPEKRDVQRPRVFYRRELEAQPWLLAEPAPTPPSQATGVSPR